MPRSFELVGIDGTNPLGFLAAVGTLVSLEQARVSQPKLLWKQHAGRWLPVVGGLEGVADEAGLVRVVADSLRGRAVDEQARASLDAAQKAMEQAKTALRKKREELSKRGLRGSARAEAYKQDLRPLEEEYERARRRWLEVRREAVPRPELALGKDIDCTPDEYREFAEGLCSTATLSDRETLDLLAAFGTDACRQPRSDKIQPTAFRFATPSGHQDFLETVRKLLEKVDAEAVHRVLFRTWDYGDERLSMRWDPIEDRRYALMDRDPTASDNKPRTMWMANLLAYRALSLFPAAPRGRRLGVAGWDASLKSFTWPIWTCPLGVDGVRSLVQLRELSEDQPDGRALRARGVVAAYRARRVEWGNGTNRKVNFSPARRVA